MFKQKATESLRSYLDRFNKVTMQIENLSDEMAIEEMKNGTRLGKLKDKIMTKEPTTFFEVISMAMKLIKLDEDKRLRRDDDRTPFKKEERSEPRRPRPQCPYFRGSTGSLASELKKTLKITHL